MPTSPINGRSAGPFGLEVIEKGRATEAHPTPLLFVHGAWFSAWCWDEHFLDFFADAGHHALAVSLRGHGASRSAKPLRSLRIADYVDDVASVADSLPVQPVLIGHSMGAYVVQKYLGSHTAAGAVLLTPAPPRGLIRSALRANRKHPWLTVKANITRSLYPFGATPPRHAGFGPSGSDAGEGTNSRARRRAGGRTLRRRHSPDSTGIRRRR